MFFTQVSARKWRNGKHGRSSLIFVAQESEIFSHNLMAINP